MNSGQFGHPFVQQEVCVIERTIRQEPLGANLLNFGLQGPGIKSVRGDVGNSLLALVPGSQHHVRSGYQPAVTPRSSFTSSNPQAYQVGSMGSPSIGSWPGHLSNVSAGNRVSGGGSGQGVDASLNMLGRDMNLSMLGREVNLAQYSRLVAGQESCESSLLRTSGVEMLKQNVAQDNANYMSGQSPVPQWLTEVINRRQTSQNLQSPIFASGASVPRAVESSRDGSTGLSSLPPFASSTTRARVVCINYDTGQRIGGELCLTQLGLLGVLCSCHGSHMSVTKFTKHVGIYSTNPGDVVAMDSTGESLVQWRRTLFSQFGVKVPEDNQGWDWSEGEVCESRPTKYKAVVTQSFQKEIDVSNSGEPLLKSRVTQVWDASVSPNTTANFQSTQSLANMGLSSNLGNGSIQESRERFLKSLARACRGNSMEFGSCPPAVGDLEENVGRNQGSADMQSLRNPSQLGPNASAEFFNFISGSQQFVSGHTEQQVAVEHQIAVSSRSSLKGLDLTWNDRREALQHEKDSSLSSFELRLGQPSQQSQSVGAPMSALANQMPLRAMMQRVLDTGRQQNMQGTNATCSVGLHTFSGNQGPSSDRPFNQQNFERASYMESNCHSTSQVDPNRGVEGYSSVLVDHSSLKRMEDGFMEGHRDRDNMLSRDPGQFSTQGLRGWPSAGSVGRSFKAIDGLLMNSESPSKRWENEAQHQIGDAVQSLSHGQQDLDTIFAQQWMSKSRASEHQAPESSGPIEGRGDQAYHGENMTQSQMNCSPSCREVCGEDKEQFAYEDMDTSRGTREGHGCACSTSGKSVSTIMNGRALSKLGEHQNFCIKELDVEGNQVEPHRQRVIRDSSQGPSTHDSSPPRVRRLKSFQAITSQGCSCGGNGTEEGPNQDYEVVSLTRSVPTLVPVVETDSGVDKRFGNPEREMAKSGLRESNNETFQWKEMGGIFVPGSETIADAGQDDMLPLRVRLEEDLLADTATKVHSTIAVSSGVSDKQPPVSDVCSKSSENALSGFSDGTGAEEEVSNAQSVDKNPVESEVVDEGSGICKCSSSDGVDMGLTPNLNMSSKDEDTQKHASPSSQGYPTFSNTEEGSALKVGTRSRGCYTGKEPVEIHVEDVVAGTGKVEKKRRRTMKWKRLDATIGAADAKRQKLSPPGNVAEIYDAPQKPMEGSDNSNSLGNKNLVQLSPSNKCGKVGAVRARKIIVTHGNRAASHAEHGMEMNAGNRMDPLSADEKYIKKTETLLIRLPQGLNRKKAKRSGRSKPGKKKMAEAVVGDIKGIKSTSPEMNAVNPAPLNNSIFKESVVTGSFISESAAVSTKSTPKHCPTLSVQPVKFGRVILGRPSPRNATRMVSLNEIMNKPEVTVTPKDCLKPSVLKDCSTPSALQDGSRAFGTKEDLKTVTSMDVMKASTSKDGLEASSLKDSVRASAVKEGIKDPSPRVGFKVSCPKEALKTQVPKESLKVKFCSSKDGVKVGKDSLKVSSTNNGLKVSSAKDGLKVSSVKDCLKLSSPEDRLRVPFVKDSLKVTSPKDSLKVSSPKDGQEASFVKDSLRISSKGGFGVSSPKGGLKVSSPKGGLKVSSPKGGLKVSSPKGGLKVSFPKDAWKASSAKDAFKLSFAKEGLKLPSPKESLKVSCPTASTQKDSLKDLAPKSLMRVPVAMDRFTTSLKAGSKGAAAKDHPKAPLPEIDLEVPSSKDGSNMSAPKDDLKSLGTKDHLKVSSHKSAWKPLGLNNGLKAAVSKDRLNKTVSKDALRHTFPSAIGSASASKDGSNTSVFKDGLKIGVPMDSLKALSKAKAEGKGKGPRKLDSSLAVVPISHDNQDKESSLAVNAWKESRNVSKSHKQDMRKVRSLHEITAEKKLPAPGTSVFEFHDEDMESSGVLKKDLYSKPFMPSVSTFSVPVHFSDSKCLVPRGERSPRGKLARMKNMFWQRHKAGSMPGSQMEAEPVEIVVGRSSVKDLRCSSGAPMTMEKEMSGKAKLWPVTTHIRFPQRHREKRESVGGTLPSAHVASSMVTVKDIFDEGMVDYTRARLQKRVLEEPEVAESAFKKQKLIELSGASAPRSGLLKIRHPLPTSFPATPTPPSSDAMGSEVKKNVKVKLQTMEDDVKISARKKRCQRPKRFNCRVPEGVVECCVCGSSVCEFFNQIVCCSQCPVKVHQACYGVKKIPNSAWFCRTCKAAATHPICVLCGYGGGAMTRAQKASGFLKGLVKVWQEKLKTNEKADMCMPASLNILENEGHAGHNFANHQSLKEKHEHNSCSITRNQEGKFGGDLLKFDSTSTTYPYCLQKHEKPVAEEMWTNNNTVASGVVDSTVVQWVHMVCALWMPGTRCLNFGTMGVFDVSGVAQARRKLICSICNRKGGACIQCRVVKCGIPFHAWCAHEKGLLQSEIVEDGSDQVGFYGKCLRHGKGGDSLNDTPDITDVIPEVSGALVGTSTCARTEGYKGKLTLEQRAIHRRQATRNGSAAVSPEQVAAWLRINEKKTCKARRFLKSANSDQKTDHREYLRFKQEQGWRRLSVYKSGIHALGLYTAEFIGRGEMVVEYIGEIVGLRVADKREADYHSGKRMQYQGACYLFRIDRERIIDATRKGGIARFVNHSCSPNCVAKVICVKNQSKVVFFAQRDIYAGEEITYDYQFNFEQEGDKIPCFCGSANCRGTLN